jgi:transcription initiation factor TFIID subunit 13
MKWFSRGRRRLTQCLEAAKVAAPRIKLKVDDFKIVLRNDSRKLGRVEELLYLQKVIAEARKQFDTEA